MTTLLRKHWTDQELLAMPKDGFKREVLGGDLIMSPAAFDHGSLISRLVAELGKVVYGSPLGELADGQTGFRLPSGDLLSPDISFVSAPRVAEHQKSKSVFFEGAPDLVVEVLSPSDTIEVMEEKLGQFFAAGTRLAWIVHPRTRAVHVYRSPTESRVLTAQDALNGEDIIPGFTMILSKLFI